MEITVESLKEELLKSGIRPSHQRIKILEHFHQKIGHPTVDEVFEVLAPEIPTLSKTTIYNTLRLFMEAGLVRAISIDGIEKRYDLMTHDHGHFICDSCGEIINFSIDMEVFPLDELKQFQIKSKNVYFNGLCPKCIDQGKEKRTENGK
ncbi:MAG: transcriptional repressor [Anaerolineae bacterium]|nr:transcriptional repressor [Anaerolineae bacterium]